MGKGCEIKRLTPEAETKHNTTKYERISAFTERFGDIKGLSLKKALLGRSGTRENHSAGKGAHFAEKKKIIECKDRKERGSRVPPLLVKMKEGKGAGEV